MAVPKAGRLTMMHAAATATRIGSDGGGNAGAAASATADHFVSRSSVARRRAAADAPAETSSCRFHVCPPLRGGKCWPNSRSTRSTHPPETGTRNDRARQNRAENGPQLACFQTPTKMQEPDFRRNSGAWFPDHHEMVGPANVAMNPATPKSNPADPAATDSKTPSGGVVSAKIRRNCEIGAK